MGKLWKVKELITEVVKNEFKELHPLVAQGLFNRGITNLPAAQFFLGANYSDLHNPFLFKDMQSSVDRIYKAFEQNEKIAVYGDYDADAVTAAAVLLRTFKYLGITAEYYIPDRFSEGYGLNIPAFEKLKSKGVTVIITVDCGTNSVDVADYCNQNGIDLIITDHHEITGDIPQSFALINPKNPNDAYPYNQITGVGVAYKLAKALLTDTEKAKKYNSDFVEGWDKWLLDLVSIGTVADCHSLIGENRILVYLGLKVLPKTRWAGLRALLRVAHTESENFNSELLGFIIAPRVNAAGRLEHASVALELLLEDNLEQAEIKAQGLEKINTRRKNLSGRILSEAREMAQQHQHRKILVLAHESWHKGLVGIVAGRLSNEFSRPVVVLEKGEQESTGSVRGYGGFDTVAALQSAKDVLVRFGGHKEAAGVTLLSSNLDSFRHKLLEFAEKEDANLQENQNVLELEAELLENDLDLKTLSALEAFAPFGAGNPTPIFLIEKAYPISVKKIGKDQTHLQISLNIGSKKLDAIGFRLGYLADNLQINQPYDFAVELIRDSWNGYEKLKLRIVDVKV